MPAVSLEDLQRQIAQREGELQALLRELESRQSQYTELTRRKAALPRQLRQVEEEIAALAAPPLATTEQPETIAPPVSSAAARAAGQPLLGELIVTMLNESGEPMTARQLCEVARRRGFQPVGCDPIKSVEARLQELKHKGVVQLASGQPGYILAPSANSASKKKNKPGQPAQTRTQKASSKPAKLETAATKSSGKGSSSVRAATMVKPARNNRRCARC
jgi:hypothetical protein